MTEFHFFITYMPLFFSCSLIWCNVMDTILTGATVIIAFANCFLTRFIFRQTRKDTSDGAKKQRRFELIHTLILNHRLGRLYEFYDDVSKECERLLESNEQSVKKSVDDKNKALLENFRKDFVMLFYVIDPQLYTEMLNIADNLVDKITNTIFDEGINLMHEPKFNIEIVNHISQNRNKMIEKLYGMANID